MTRRSWVEHAMGMPVSLLLRGRVDDVDEVVTRAYAELRRADEVFSTYRDDSDIARLRRGELDVGDADPLVAEVLSLCARAKADTGGWFDVDLPGGLDPSGLVKSWAAERALAVLTELPAVDVCLNVGGDVVVHAPSGAPFVVGIQDPHDRARVVATVASAGGGVATSGTAARGTHIVDPHTGAPAAAVASVTVVGPSLMWADVWATAAFAEGGGLDRIGALPSYEAMVVHLDGRLEMTAGWPGLSVQGEAAG